MNPILFILMQLRDYGEEIPEGTLFVEVGTHEIVFHGVEHEEEGYHGRKYTTTVIDSFEFDNERLGPDQYQYDFDGKYTIGTLLAATETYNEDLRAFQEAQKMIMEELAGLAKKVEQDIALGIQLANKFAVPFMVNGNDFRQLKSVDWDSSSMYC